MVIRGTKSNLIPACVAALGMLMLLAAAGPHAASAQDGETAVLLRAWACPDASPVDPFTECEAIVGATYRIEANGAETAGSPVTTVQETGIGPGVNFGVPAGADLTITQLSGAPDGYVPAPGFDPFAANVAALPQVGFGGESTGPGVNFINVPADSSGDDTGDQDGPTGENGDTDAAGQETTTLPETGTGATGTATLPGIVPVLIAATLLLAVAATSIRRESAR